jgi:hypothetical protein
MNTASVRVALGRAIELKSAEFTVITHAVYDAIGKRASEGVVAPKCYCHMHGLKNGAADLDGRWKKIHIPDVTGFRGFTSFMPMKLRPASEHLYDPNGIGERSAGVKDYLCMDSTVICIESAPQQEQYFHSAVDIGIWYILPPFTLLEVVDVQEPGEWEYLPGKRINQALITVRPTYLVSAKVARDGAGRQASSKFASNRTFLSYGSSQDAARGIDDITAVVVLTMEQEWMRDDHWCDFKGTRFSAADEWEYVTGAIDPEAASKKRKSGVGERDAGRDGWTPEKFQQVVNDSLQEQVAMEAQCQTQHTGSGGGAESTAAAESAAAELGNVDSTGSSANGNSELNHTGPRQRPNIRFLQKLDRRSSVKLLQEVKVAQSQAASEHTSLTMEEV